MVDAIRRGKFEPIDHFSKLYFLLASNLKFGKRFGKIYDLQFSENKLTKFFICKRRKEWN